MMRCSVVVPVLDVPVGADADDLLALPAIAALVALAAMADRAGRACDAGGAGGAGRAGRSGGETGKPPQRGALCAAAAVAPRRAASETAVVSDSDEIVASANDCELPAEILIVIRDSNSDSDDNGNGNGGAGASAGDGAGAGARVSTFESPRLPGVALRTTRLFPSADPPAGFAAGLAAGFAAGFAEACNAGAALATHDRLLFLASDLQPHAGWLPALVRGLADSTRVAAAGSLLLASADTAYHAGIVIDTDGWPRRLYAGFPATHPAVTTSRVMQLADAASLLVRRDAFDRAGGFDPALAAEDAAFDLCLRLGELGYELRYCHDSVATCPPAGPRHGESAARLARSRRLFRTRWVRRARPDDVTFYLRDRLLRVSYDDAAGARVSVAPPLVAASAQAALAGMASADGEISAFGAERLLLARSAQVRALLDDNARLTERIAALEAVVRAHAPDRCSRAGAGTGGSVNGHADNSGGGSADDDLLPPTDLALSVGGTFRETGEEFLTYFIEIGGLRPDAAVLEVGCGVGRMAVPLTRYLTGDGRYDGFDVMANAIGWCQAHVTPRFPRFRFRHAALRNRAYNTIAAAAAEHYRFPYPPASFDFVFLTSVFTHLMPHEVRHYLAQIAAVLKPGGRCFSTFFLLNPESEGLMRTGFSPHFPFAHRHDGYRIQDPAVPEAAVAYDESQIAQWHADAGLAIADPIRYGTWCGRLDGLSLQDIVLATRSA